MKKIVIVILLSAFFSCSPALYVPTEKNASDAASLEELKKGRSLYVGNCGSCHSLHLPEEFSAEAWDGHLEVMQKKAKVSDEQKILILKYLRSER